MQKTWTDTGRTQAAIDETVIELADANREGELAALIAQRARIDASVAAKALSGERVEATAAVCRLAGLPLNSYSAVLRMRVRNRRSPILTPAALLAAYRHTADASPAELAECLRVSGCAT